MLKQMNQKKISNFNKLKYNIEIELNNVLQSFQKLSKKFKFSSYYLNIY